jgi:phenylpropionate dioxygenase-like ring-hydroxylating dioxygenase large terminal subunit
LAANWSLFTWSARVTDPGDYVSGVVAGYPVFVMRGDDGALRGFHNVCRPSKQVVRAEFNSMMQQEVFALEIHP